MATYRAPQTLTVPASTSADGSVPTTIIDHRPQRVALSVREWAALVGISLSTAHEQVRRGDVRSVRLGGRRLIPASEVERLFG
jgi:excisionase family DNA binding protein